MREVIALPGAASFCWHNDELSAKIIQEGSTMRHKIIAGLILLEVVE